MALVPDNANEAESKKFEMEFEEYQKKLKVQKDEWVKQNPDQVGPQLKAFKTSVCSWQHWSRS